jgi:crotonobetainyl-CoA:carnitine CoA-transferase CaiB-like acyl-CoA transferase
MGLNRNKRGMRLDLTQPGDREQLMTLLADADVLLENFKTGTLEKWGIGYDTLKVKFPRLVHCRVSGYGADGPLGGLPGYDAAIQALSGIMSVNGEVGGEPLRVGLPVVDMVTGLNAVIGILMALQERQRSGLGQFVETALYDCGLSLLHPHAANWFGDGRLPGRTGNAHPNIYPYDAFPTKTTPVFLAVGNDRQFQQLCEVLGQAQLAHASAFSSAANRSVNRVQLREQLITHMASLDGEVLVQQLSDKGVPCAPILDVPHALNHPHTAHRHMTVSLPGGYKGLASPIKLSRTPATYRLPPPASI